MEIQRWDTCELVLHSEQEYENPFRDVELTGTFTHTESGRQIVVNGFYDGGSTWRIRFMATELGEWTFKTSSRDANLDGKTGTITCVPAKEPYLLRGPLKAVGHHFFHADGTPRFLVSARLSCHFSPAREWEDTIDFFKDHGINRVLFMITGIAKTTARLFEDGADGPDFDRYRVESWQAIDTFIDALRRAGLLASPYFYYFNDQVQLKMTKEQDRAFIRYGMARFGAYANVMPVLSNEVEQKATTRKGQYDLYSHEWANEMGTYLKECSVFGLPVSVHNPMETQNAASPGFYALLRDWQFPFADYMLRQAQVGALGAAEEIRDDIPEARNPVYNERAFARHNELLIDMRRFGIPVINEEPGYEMSNLNPPHAPGKHQRRPWNSQNTETLIRTFWSAVMAGAYVMWGPPTTYNLDDPLELIKESRTPRALKVLHDFFADLPYWDMEPMNERVVPQEVEIGGVGYRTNFCLGRPGGPYVVFSLDGGEITVTLDEGRVFRVVRMDALSGEKRPLGRVDGGVQTLYAYGSNLVFLFRPV